MSERNYSWKELDKKIKNLKYFSYLYISVGIVLLLIGNYKNSYPPTPLFYGLSSMLFGGVLGFLSHQYDYIMCGQEIAAWQSLASPNSIGYMFGRK
jgi:RsiW-degrading membrane proteinase PrsW (M82 family)